MNLTTILTAAGSLLVLTGGSFGVVQFADQRYAPAAALDDVQWSSLKGEIRAIRRHLEDNPSDRRAMDDLEDAIDRLCKAFPKDRECAGR
jgi:ribosomal protein S15P/S13E